MGNQPSSSRPSSPKTPSSSVSQSFNLVNEADIHRSSTVASSPSTNRLNRFRSSRVPRSLVPASPGPMSAPPPYSPTDSNANTPPPVPPRDYLATSGSQSSVIGRRASFQPSSGSTSGNSAPQNHRRVVSTASPPRRSPPPAAGDDVYIGGFLGEMMPTTGLGSRHTQVRNIPAGSRPSARPVIQTRNIGPSDQQSASPTHFSSGLARRGSIEEPLELLRRFDTVCLVDDSSSMEGALWFEAREALAGIADVASKYDADGLDIHFLNSPTIGRNLRNAVEVKRLFDQVQPRGITPTGERLEALLLDYLLRLEAARDAADAGDVGAMKTIKPVNFVVITDGAATDDPEPVIIQAAKRLDARSFPLSQVGIQFVQIGDDPDAADALQEMDDGLAAAHGIRDIVDTVPYSAGGGVLTSEMLTKILLGGINRRIDRRNPTL